MKLSFCASNLLHCCKNICGLLHYSLLLDCSFFVVTICWVLVCVRHSCSVHNTLLNIQTVLVLLLLLTRSVTNKWRTHWLRVFPELRGKYVSRHLWLCVCCKVGTGSKSTTLDKETQVLAVGVKPHPRLVCSTRRTGSIDCVASATTYTFSAQSLFCVFQWDILVPGCPHPWIISPMRAEPYISSTLSYPALCWIND